MSLLLNEPATGLWPRDSCLHKYSENKIFSQQNLVIISRKLDNILGPDLQIDILLWLHKPYHYKLVCTSPPHIFTN